MKRQVEDMIVITLPVFYDWTLEDVYRLSLESGESESFKLQPDGEPRGWGNVVEYKGSAYIQRNNTDCSCSFSETGKVCEHWRKINVNK